MTRRVLGLLVVAQLCLCCLPVAGPEQLGFFNAILNIPEFDSNHLGGFFFKKVPFKLQNSLVIVPEELLIINSGESLQDGDWRTERLEAAMKRIEQISESDLKVGANKRSKSKFVLQYFGCYFLDKEFFFVVDKDFAAKSTLENFKLKQLFPTGAIEHMIKLLEPVVFVHQHKLGVCSLGPKAFSTTLHVRSFKLISVEYLTPFDQKCPVGNKGYSSLESRFQTPAGEKIDSRASDVYSLGMMFLSLFADEMDPFLSLNANVTTREDFDQIFSDCEKTFSQMIQNKESKKDEVRQLKIFRTLVCSMLRTSAADRPSSLSVYLTLNFALAELKKPVSKQKSLLLAENVEDAVRNKIKEFSKPDFTPQAVADQVKKTWNEKFIVV